jgi:hypothetical protein
MSFVSWHYTARTARLSRAATQREGRAPSRPIVAAEPLPALDSDPTGKIGAVGGQDALRMTPMRSFGKSCPQPSGKRLHDHAARSLVRADQQGDGGRRGPRDVRSGEPAPTPHTDRGVEIERDNT